MLAYTTRHEANAALVFPALVDLYAVVYAEPPYEEGPEQVARFADHLPDEATTPGFTLVTAEDDGTLIGGAYGWTMPAGRWWTRPDGPAPDGLLDVDKLAVMEWVVHPHRRGEGVGAELMRRLLAFRPERYATLAADPRSHARKVYARNGWRQVGKSVLPWGPPMDLLVLDLTSPTVQHG